MTGLTIIRPRPYEEWVKELSEAIAEGRKADSETARATAVAKIRKLVGSDGEAEYWLTRKR